jgi:hypothetical protein
MQAAPWVTRLAGGFSVRLARACNAAGKFATSHLAIATTLLWCRLREGLTAARERLPDLPHPVRSAVAAIRQRLQQRREL